MKYKVIIFDLDGTLLDTLDDLKDACNYALAKNGLPTVSRERVRISLGNGIKKLIERVSSNIHYEECLVDFQDYYKLHLLTHTRFYEGTVEALKELKEDYKLFVISNKFNDGVQLLHKKFFEGLITESIGPTGNLEPKPSFSMFQYLMEKYHFEKSDIMYVGDSDVDASTCQKLGIDYFILTTGFRTKEEMLALNIPNLKEHFLPNISYLRQAIVEAEESK